MLPLRAADPKELDALLKKQVELKKGDRIVFLGDSSTFLGGGSPRDWLRLSWRSA